MATKNAQDDKVYEGGSSWSIAPTGYTSEQAKAEGYINQLPTQRERPAVVNLSNAVAGAIGAIPSALGAVIGDVVAPYGGGVGVGGSPSARRNTYTAATLPSATSQADYINAMYDANERRQRAALEQEYTANLGALDRQAATIPAQYQTAANQASTQAAINRANYNEQAAATGLNTGARGQAALAQNNALLANISNIRQAQSDAMKDVEKQRVALQAEYQKAIADAIANNEADRAAALYNEAKRVDESLVSTAVNQATENYRAWQAAYG